MGHAQQHLDGRGLARPVAAQQSVDRPLGNPQVEAIDRTMAAVVLRQAMGDDHVGHGYDSYIATVATIRRSGCA